jgi:hypothetical protein
MEINALEVGIYVGIYAIEINNIVFCMHVSIIVTLN